MMTLLLFLLTDGGPDVGRLLSVSMLLFLHLLLHLLLLIFVMLLGNDQLQLSLLLFLLRYRLLQRDASTFFALVDYIVDHAVV